MINAGVILLVTLWVCTSAIAMQSLKKDINKLECDRARIELEFYRLRERVWEDSRPENQRRRQMQELEFEAKKAEIKEQLKKDKERMI